jgi:hypothetical protein
MTTKSSSSNQINQWPALLGKKVDDAKAQILKDAPGIDIKTLPQGSATTRDYRINRVRIFYDKNNLVSAIPKRG